MKKRILLQIILIQIAIVSLFSAEFDWGGAIQNTTDASSVGGWSVTQIDSLSLWAELDVNPLLKFKASGGYRFSYADGSISHIPEFGALYAYGSSNLISYKAGRFTLKDINNNLFSTIIDGAQFGLKNEIVKINSGVGFTGLVFNKNSSVAMTSMDFDAMSNDAILAAPRLAEYAEAAFYILPGDGSLTVGLLAQQDLRATSSVSAGEGLLHSFYLNLGLKGRLGSLLFYNFYGTGMVGLYDMTADSRQVVTAGGAGGLKIDLPLPLPLKPLISVDLYYSSGDNWDRTDHQGSSIDAGKDVLTQFTPFTLQNKGYVYSVGVGNLFYGDVTISISPFSFFSVAVESLTLFRAVDGPVSALPVSEGSSGSSLYLGEEITLSMNFRPLSDLGFQVKGGVFIPNDSVVSDGIQYKVGGFLSLSF